MDFFEAQDAARGRTRTLVVLYVTAVLCIIAAIYAVVHAVLGPGIGRGVDPALLLLVALLVSLLVGIGSAVRTAQLRHGGSRVAELLGGRRVKPNTDDAAERRLVNVVEEMAIASGTPLPAIYVLDHEPGINAFAAGFTIDDAAVAVTRGTLDKLNRDELQGVIAHEFSHILNGDMRLNIRLMGLLFGILLLAVVGRGLLYSGGRGRRRDGGNQIAIVGIALVLVGWIGVFFGRLIQAAVSRQREFLADAAAVQFTRNPEGITGALSKIGAAGSRLQDHHAQEASHLFFANGIGSAFVSLLATHPPLEERIRRLQPGQVAAAPRGEQLAAASAHGFGASERHAGASGFAGGAGRTAAVAGEDAGTGRGVPHEVGAGGAAAASGAALVASVGAPQPAHVAYAARLLNSLPAAVVEAAHDPERAPALLFALLLHDEEESARDTQRRALAELGFGSLRMEVDTLALHVRSAGPAARLPLLDLLLPALRELTRDERQQLRSAARRLVEADARVEMFELAVLHVLNRQLGDDPTPSSRGAGTGTNSIADVRGELELVLSAVAWSGAATATEAEAAFAAGRQSVERGAPGIALQSPESMEMTRVDEALGGIRAASAAVRRRALEACMLTVAHDGRVQTREAETLRAVAEAIDCPMPPVLA
jgi:Zn-dependent protease with chaperone function